MTNHYQTLGVDPQAETVVIRSAYLSLIRRFHPDKGGEEADAARAQAVTAAWDVLRDPQRRAAYDETRRARFQPDAAAGTGGRSAAVYGHEVRVRGGAAGRNLFLLLATGTIGLGWWALGQPQPDAPVSVAARSDRPVPSRALEPAIRPAVDDGATLKRADIEEREQPSLPDSRPEPEVDAAVVLPSLPVRDSARSAQAQPVVRRAVTREQGKPEPSAPSDRRTVQTGATVEVRSADPQVDLAPLERHLQLLTDQSFRFGTEAKKSRLASTREVFLTRLRNCDSDLCKRDEYLRRNAEVGEIMRN